MAAADPTRYGELCRLCASKVNIVIALNIFSNEGTMRQINKKIETCLPVQVHEADELPKMICDNCLYKLELLFDFRDRAMRTETLLVDLYKELNATRLQNEHMVKMNVVPMDHSDLIMVDQHQLLTDHNIQNVNEIDLSHLGQRNNIIVEHEIILSHQNVDLSSHSLDTISLNHNLTNQDLSNHSLSGANTILVDESGSMHGIADVRYSEANLDLIRHEHMLTEQYRLQNSIQVAISESSLNNSLNESIQLPNNSLCKEHETLTSPNSIQNQSPQSEMNDSDPLQIDTNFNNFKSESSEGNKTPTHYENKQETKDDKEWFYCNMCGNTFENKPEFDMHYDQHFNKCIECLAVFTNQDALNSHKKEVHGSRPENYVNVIKEDKLKKPQNTSESGIKEEDSESEDGNDFEGIEEEEDDPDLGTEVNDTGGTKRKKWSPKVCKECGKSYRTNYKLTEHMRKHTGEKPYKCKSCEKAFRSKIGLAQHEAKHTGKYDYSCPTCGKGFQCKSYLMVHQRVHSDLKPYPCTTCGRNFKTKQSLLDHTNRHLGVKPYMCDICGRGFITKGLCRAHQKVHSGADNRKYSCNVCSKRFVSKSYLQTHYRIHTGEKPFMCEVCGKGFLTRVDLRIHSTMHTGEKSYVCEMCGKAFARRDALRCHRRSHTGERPYSCDQCGQTFTQFSPMAIHKRLHTGERPYVCEMCGKKFVSRSTMMAHSKKHDR